MTLKYIPLDSATSVTSPQPEYKGLSFGIFTQKVRVLHAVSSRKKRKEAGQKNLKGVRKILKYPWRKQRKHRNTPKILRTL